MDMILDFQQIEVGQKAQGKSGFSSDAGNSELTTEKLFNDKPSVKMSMKKGRKEWAWGGVINLPKPAVKGDTVYIQVPMAVPEDMNFFSSDNYNTKWIRGGFKTAEGKKAHYVDIYIHNKDGDNRQFAYILEGHNKWHYFGDKTNPQDSIVHDGEFAEYQAAITLDDKSVDDGGKGRVRFYKNGVLVKNGDITGRPTMVDPTQIMSQVYLGTYWNGGVPQDQYVYVGDIRVSTQPDAKDAEGNPMLKSSFQPAKPVVEVTQPIKEEAKDDKPLLDTLFPVGASVVLTRTKDGFTVKKA